MQLVGYSTEEVMGHSLVEEFIPLDKLRGASPQGQFYLIQGEMGRFGKKRV
jgi:hypothetical protein